MPDDYYQVGFLTHVEKAGFVVGIAGSVTTAFLIIMMLEMQFYKMSSLVFMGIVLCAYLMVTASKYAKLPNLCWLALIINPISVALIAVVHIWPALVFVTAPDYDDNYNDYKESVVLLNLGRTMAIMEVTLSFGAICLIAYFQSVIYRFYVWMKKQNSEMHTMAPMEGIAA
ncbi:hypothetical protein DdX_06042 [Ditylenchus destructor]|uniref:Uncharacterized protein n=1 Tax=Ditylenchus destructor TaxID=166010 RepID=A0AAD4N838_9BILA|nr:hypothetical protein DdX_06042 [Ditylenchus destructor]